jgi:L,D-peptidoglycan transpeptidase YkuD (ErfK/YbiS/YcfS/YnhG family)
VLSRRAALAGFLPAAFAPVRRIVVSARPYPVLTYGDVRLACFVGHGGVRPDKFEGDGATPVGAFALRRLFYRPDRVAPVASGLPVAALRPSDGWSDDPGDPAYNRLASLPSRWHREAMWRADRLYDVVIVIGYNDSPPVAGKGSAIFLHVAVPGMTGSDGCVAIPLADIVRLAALCDTSTIIEIRNE